MALTYTSGMTEISDGETIADWQAYRLAGSGGAPGEAVDSSVFKTGAGSISSDSAGNNWDAGLLFDYFTANASTALNMTTAGNEVLRIWVNNDRASKILTQANDGLYIIVSSSTETTGSPTAYRKWTIHGSDTYSGGWILVTIDTQKYKYSS